MLYLLVGIVWVPIEIILKALSLRVLNAADSGDGATCTIMVIFYLDLTAFGVLELCAILCLGLIIYLNSLDEDQKKKGSKDMKNKQTPDEEKQGGS
jgi:NADH:ubiquinone oxidoreductase subunit K